MEKLPISCIIVNYNEAKRLRECLHSVTFCDEIIFIDLGSSDNSLIIAQQFNCTIIHHERVPIGEIARYNNVANARYDWILCADPDEIIDPSLISDIYGSFSIPLESIGSFAFPWQFYFKNKKLKGTVWGNIDRKKSVLHHRKKVIFPNQVHTTHKLLNGYEEIVIRRNGDNVIHHYWVDSFGQLFEKHKRYLDLEGEMRFKKGQRYTVKQHLIETLRAFAASFIFTKGWKEGWHGWFLSFFYSWYIFMCWRALKIYEKKYA